MVEQYFRKVEVVSSNLTSGSNKSLLPDRLVHFSPSPASSILYNSSMSSYEQSPQQPKLGLEEMTDKIIDIIENGGDFSFPALQNYRDLRSIEDDIAKAKDDTKKVELGKRAAELAHLIKPETLQRLNDLLRTYSADQARRIVSAVQAGLAENEERVKEKFQEEAVADFEAGKLKALENIPEPLRNKSGEEYEEIVKLQHQLKEEAKPEIKDEEIAQRRSKGAKRLNTEGAQKILEEAAKAAEKQRREKADERRQNEIRKKIMDNTSQSTRESVSAPINRETYETKEEEVKRTTTQTSRKSISAPINRESESINLSKRQEIERQTMQPGQLAPIAKPKKSLWGRFWDIFG